MLGSKGTSKRQNDSRINFCNEQWKYLCSIDTPYHDNGEIRGQIDLLRKVNSTKQK
jgi:hypothetical protein